MVLDNQPFLLSDTVGFIRKLPHDLIESFKSTLDEVREADLLIHVVDLSHPQFEDHIKVVNDTLKDIESGNKKTLLLFNKIDAYHPDPEDEILAEESSRKHTLAELKKTWMNHAQTDVIFISAQKKLNLEELRAWIVRHVAN
jgi:GTP-binding protein HflX